MSVARKQSRRRGFSLLELLIVLAIMGMISAAVVPQLLGRQQDASIRNTRAGIHSVEMAAKLYGVQLETAFPAGSEEVFDLLCAGTDVNSRPAQPHLEDIPTDAWGEPLNYCYPPTHQTILDKPDIWSSGPNGVDENGSGDDVNNWDDQEDEYAL